MPSLDKIEKFVDILNALGHEPEVLKELGETLQKVQRPEQGLSSDLQSLFQDLGDLDPGAAPSARESAAEEPAAAEAPEGGLPLDFSTVMNEPAPAEAEQTDEFEASDGFEMPSIDESAFQAETSDEVPVPAQAEAPVEAEVQAEAEAPAAEEFVLDEEPASGDAEAEEFTMPEEFSLPEPAGPAEEPSFEEPSAAAGEPSFDEPSFEAPSAPAIQAETEGKLEEMPEASAEDASADEFSLGDFGAQFGLTSGAAAAGGPESEEELNPAAGVPDFASDTGAAHTTAEGFSIRDPDFTRLQENLRRLPHNVKLAVEQIVGGSKAPVDEQIRIIKLLVAGAAPQTVAQAAGKILGKTIRVPRGYEKKTFEELEAEKRGLAWIFRETILPVLRIIAAGAAGLGLLVLLGYNFVYRPLNADWLYKRGFELIEKENRFREGNQHFERAWKQWESRDWFFKYAELFIAKNNDETDHLAEEKYAELLRSYADFPGERGLRTAVPKDAIFRKGVLDFARFVSEYPERFRDADRIIEGTYPAQFPNPQAPGKPYTLTLPGLLQQDMYDYDGLLLRGDNYLRWSARENEGEEKMKLLEAARRTYMLLLEKHGDRREVLFRVLDYWVAAGDAGAALEFKKSIETLKDFRPDPAAWASLAGLLLDKGRADNEVENMLIKAYEVEKDIPDLHYHLARYYRQRGDRKNEAAALGYAEQLVKGKLDEGNGKPAGKPQRRPPRLTRHYTRMRLDLMRRSGENLFGEQQYKPAEKLFMDGIRRYEDAVVRGLVTRQSDLGRLYSGLGDVLFYGYGNYGPAYDNYQRAEENLVVDPRIMYRKGYILYHHRSDFLEAVREFRRVEGERGPEGEALRENRNLLYAMAAGFLSRRDYFAAEGYYLLLKEKLEHRLRQENFRPFEKELDRSVLEMLMRAYNNYGVVLHQIGRRTGDRQLASRSAYFLTRSSELYENFHRDQQSLARSPSKNLAYLNMRAILQPRLGLDMQNYPAIPQDLSSLQLD